MTDPANHSANRSDSLESEISDFTEPPIVIASLVSLPRVWTVFLASFGAIAVGTVVGGIVMVIAMFTIAGVSANSPPPDTMDLVAKVAEHPFGIWILVIPGQVCFAAVAFCAATLSPVPLHKRLRLGQGRFPVWTWILMAVATPTLAILISVVLSSLQLDQSEHLKFIEQMLKSQGGSRIIVTAFLIAVVPGIAEELLFRGYLQSRLLQRWTASFSIFISAAIFALAHIDPIHIIAVFPLGVWIGVVAWKTGSVWPAVLCHFTNNCFALVSSQFNDSTISSLNTLDYVVLAPSILAMIACISLFIRPKFAMQITSCPPQS